MTDSQFNREVIPSPTDERDYSLATFGVATATVFPDEFMTPGTRLPASDQGGYGMCVAYSLKVIKEYQELKERGSLTRWSPTFIYGNRTPEQWQGEGMVVREALDSLIKDGTCSSKSLSINQNYIFCKQQITSAMRAEAVPQHIAAYGKCWNDDEVKTALMNFGPVVFAFPIYIRLS